MNRFPKTFIFCLGLVSSLGFAPLGWWPITLAALALFMNTVRSAATLGSALTRGYIFGLGHFIVGLNWIAGAFHFQDSMPEWFGWIAVVIVALIVSIYPAMVAGIAWRFGRADALRFTLFFAAAWIVSEWLRATWFSGFAWNPLGVMIVDIPIIRDTARIFGSYGVSAWLTLVAGALMIGVPRWVKSIRENWSNGTWLSFALGRPALLMAAVLLSAVAINRIDLYTYSMPSQRPLIHIVQPNIGQQNKHLASFVEVNFAKLKRLTGKPTATPRLILWPEAAIPDYLDEKDGNAQEARARIAALLGPRDIVLTGAVKRYFKRTRVGDYIQEELVGARNAMFALDAKGRLLTRYDKAHLVPGGEYLPFKPLLSAIGLTRLVPGTVDFWPGPGPRSLNISGFGKVGVQICYEVIFSGHVIDPANRPDVLFNPSNDAWFGPWGPPQHLAQARLRAIEEAMPVIRSTPTGISAVIDARGTVIKSLPLNSAGFIQMRLPPPAPPPLFSKFGNIMSFALALILAALGVALRFQRR